MLLHQKSSAPGRGADSQSSPCHSLHSSQLHRGVASSNRSFRIRATTQPSLQYVADAAGAAISRLQRYVQPPPEGFPAGPSGDQSLNLLTDPLAFLTRLRRDHGPVVGIMLGGERVVVVAEPSAARQVLIDQSDVFIKSGTAFFPGSSLTGNGLLVSDGEVWRRQRRLSNPAFRKAAVDRYSEAMVSESQRLLDGPFAAAAAANSKQQQQQRQHQRQYSGRTHMAAPAAAAAAPSPLSSPGVRDVYTDFNQLTLNITLAALFGITDAEDSSRSSSSSSGSSGGNSKAALIVAAVEKAFTYFAARGATAMVVPEWVPTPDNLAFKEAVQQLDDLVYGIIDARKAANSLPQQQQQQQQQLPPVEGTAAPSTSSSGSSGVAAAPDLLQALLDSVDESGQPMSRTALRDELMTLLVAGQETSAILLGWAAALLAHNPRVQAAAAAEVGQVLCDSSSSNNGRTPVAADIAQLPLVTAVVLEALRLWSPAYMVGRCACQDVTLAGGYKLPKGTTCLVSPYLLHREPTRWRQPLQFKPERWLPLLQQQQQPAQQQQQQQQCSDSSAEDSSTGVSGCPMHQHSKSAATAAADSSSSSSGGSSSSGSSSGSSSSSSGVPSGYSFAAVLRELGPNGAFVPFGGGPRNCIGTGFAMTEVVLVLAMMLQRYELQPVSPAAGFPRPKPMLTLRPEAVPLRLMYRQQQGQQRQQGQQQQQQQEQSVC